MSKIFVILSVLAMALATTACGGSSAVSIACSAGCDKGDSLACEDSMIDSDTCNAMCDAYGSTPSACQDAAEAYFVCANALDWECGLMGPTPADGGAACDAESTAMNSACEG